MAKKKKNQYIDNVKFFEEMLEYHEKRIAAEERGEQPPAVNNYIGKCMVDIATHLAFKPNFYNYPFREEMIGDGIENAMRAVNNFDPTKFSNPFAYFTQVIYWAFVRRIQKEKKELYTKSKLQTNMNVYQENTGGASPINIDNPLTDYMEDFVERYEEKMKS